MKNTNLKQKKNKNGENMASLVTRACTAYCLFDCNNGRDGCAHRDKRTKLGATVERWRPRMDDWIVNTYALLNPLIGNEFDWFFFLTDFKVLRHGVRHASVLRRPGPSSRPSQINSILKWAPLMSTLIRCWAACFQSPRCPLFTSMQCLFMYCIFTQLVILANTLSLSLKYRK